MGFIDHCLRTSNGTFIHEPKETDITRQDSLTLGSVILGHWLCVFGPKHWQVRSSPSLVLGCSEPSSALWALVWSWLRPGAASPVQVWGVIRRPHRVETVVCVDYCGAPHDTSEVKRCVCYTAPHEQGRALFDCGAPREWGRCMRR